MLERIIINDIGAEQVGIFESEIAECIKNVIDLIPDGIEKSLFLTHLDTAIFFATKAISGKEGNFSKKIDYMSKE